MVVKKKNTKTDLTIDRATVYAQSVISGDFIAGPHVRGACQRHINDLTRDDFPYWFDPVGAKKAIGFFEKYLLLNGGQYEGKPFNLLPWQDFIIGSLFGWKRNDNNKRRFRVAYIEKILRKRLGTK